VLARLSPGLARPVFPLNGVGAFPDWRRPRVLWIGAGAGGEDLEDLARRLDLGFGEAGLGRADKPFKTHLTIGRVREGSRLDPGEIEALRREPFATPPFEVVALRLMASELTRDGARHGLIEAWPIGGAAASG
jgi:2'-5' RNA ligase